MCPDELGMVKYLVEALREAGCCNAVSGVWKIGFLQELSQGLEARLDPQLDIGEGLHLGQGREQGLEQEQEV